MKRKIVSLSTAILASAILLSACGNNNTTGAANQTEVNQPAANTNNAANTTAPAEDASGLFTAADMTKLPDIAKKRTDTIIVGLTDPSGAFTPYFQQSGYDGNVSSLLYTPLVKVDDKGLPIPGLAEKWEVSADNMTYTYHLRKDLKFSDGSPLTAEDVAFTWTILYDKSYDGDSMVNTLHIQGGDAYKAGTAANISGIKVIDPQTIAVVLEKPNASALTLLGSDVLSKAYYGKDYKQGQLDYMKKLSGSPLGTGPYKLEKFIPGQEVRMIANENYFDGKPKTEHFIYKTAQGDTWQYLETGEVDYASFTATKENIDKLKALGFVNILPYTPSTYGYLQLNLKHPALQDKLVRQALTYGLDRQSIYVDAAQGAGQVANIPSSPISWSYTEEDINPYKFDPEKAKELLDQAGWKAGADGIREKDGKKLTIHYLGYKKPETDVFIAVAKEDFEALGIKFEPEVFADFNALVSKVEGGDYDMASFSTSLLTDPSDGLLQFVDGEIPGYDDATFKELYAKGLATSNIEERKAVYKDIYKLLNDQLPIIFTNYKKSVYAYNGRIQNLSVSPFNGLAPSLPNWTLSQ
ncbi:ABC transporter substrate-binding protein [Paenibacillus sp. BC26]|uniref:ABC transporter substrate-binding protein n=1 Tax=Paenibacillus sp. BC26 TaxID=1881032 RepID=UPI0008EAD600|nr:ABC transporter substrate-binding protein [Paenibacillus sp. BC26]SFS48691.1 peptide/nickel transport system substrate-binding protein [Paenibacillus sp. BC26]